MLRLAGVRGVVIEDHGQHRLPGDRWRISVILNDPSVLPQLDALGLDVRLTPLDTSSGPVVLPETNRGGARALVGAATRIAKVDVLDLSTEAIRGSLTPDELLAFRDALAHGIADEGHHVVTTPPWQAVLVIRMKTGEAFVAQLVGEQWLYVDRPDPLTRQRSPLGHQPSQANEISLLSEHAAWMPLERILGQTTNKEYLIKEPR